MFAALALIGIAIVAISKIAPVEREFGQQIGKSTGNNKPSQAVGIGKIINTLK